MKLDEAAAAQLPVVEAAWRFLQSFYGSGDLLQAWPHVDPLLRLCWAQWWLCANQAALETNGYALDEVAEALVVDEPTHPLWGDFQRVLVRDFTAVSPVDLDTAGIGAAPRVIGLDIELLYVHREVPADGLWPAGASAEVVALMMRLSGSHWRVLNLGYEAVPIPGWPPQLWDGPS